MKTEMRKLNLLSPRWWNPLFWLVVVLGPVLGMFVGTVAGAFYGLLIGYERGLDAARNKTKLLISKLP